MSSIFKLADPDYKFEKLVEPILNEIKEKGYEISKTEKNDCYKFMMKSNDYKSYIDFLIKDQHNIKDYSYYTFSIQNVIEANKKEVPVNFFILCKDGLYAWTYNDNDIMINYDWNDSSNNICYRFSVMHDKFKLFN
jgi:hypothetical protein